MRIVCSEWRAAVTAAAAAVMFSSLDCPTTNAHIKGKKVKEADLYSAFILKYLTLKALRYGSHSVTCKLHRTCLYIHGE